MRETEKALMARGLDFDGAAKLASGGWPINKLKLARKTELKTVGLSDTFIEDLFKEARSPIPTKALMNVLFAHRHQCCVCRNHNLSVCVHHIEEWAASRL